MRGVIAVLVLMVIGCVGAPPVECVQQAGSVIASPTCEGDAGDGYEWRVLCDHPGDLTTIDLDRYLGCGTSPTTGEMIDRRDEVAYCSGSTPLCLVGEAPRCVAIPCDGELHRGDP